MHTNWMINLHGQYTLCGCCPGIDLVTTRVTVYEGIWLTENAMPIGPSGYLPHPVDPVDRILLTSSASQVHFSKANFQLM